MNQKNMDKVIVLTKMQNLQNVKIEVTGDLVSNDSALVICNHQSLADHIMMAYLARCSNNFQNENNFITLPRTNFFSWFLIWRVPTLRILFNLLKSDENWELESSLSQTFFKKIMNSKIPEWIILFPEANVWNAEDCRLHQKQCEKYYLPVLQNLLYPRFSGFYNAISSLNNKQNNKISTIYDVTIFYLKKPRISATESKEYGSSFAPPTLLKIFSSEDEIEVKIHVKSKLIMRVPTKRKRLERWLEHCWVEKDKFITNEYLSHQIEPIVSTSLIDKPITSLLTSPSTNEISK